MNRIGKGFTGNLELGVFWVLDSMEIEIEDEFGIKI